MLRNTALAIVVVVSSCTLGTPMKTKQRAPSPPAAVAPQKAAGEGEGEGAPSAGEGEGAASASEGEGATAGEGEGAPNAGEGEGEGASTTSNIPPPSTTRTALLANNTAAADNFVDQYQPASRFNGGGVVSNGDAAIASSSGAASTSADLSVGLVSKLNVSSLVGDVPVFVETQTWFCTNGNGIDALPQAAPDDQCKSHIDVGYHSNFRDHVKRQVDDMMSRGISGVIMDWAGSAAGTGSIDDASASSSAVVAGAVIAMRDEAESRNGAFHFAVLYDEKNCAGTSGCDVTQQVKNDIAFANANYFSSTAYFKTSDGRPVLFFFSVDAWAQRYNKSIDWAAVRSSANSHGNPVFVFENAGGFTHADSDGAYSWVSPHLASNGPGNDPFDVAGFLPYFYSQVASHASSFAWSSAFKGFDDAVVNGWGGGTRIVGQQCGKTWLDALAMAAQHAGDVDGVQLVTWDDYEEGTELESGIDNHVDLGASIAGTSLTWRVALDDAAPDDCTQAVASGFDLADTIDHFAVYTSSAGDGEGLALLADNVAASSRSFDLAPYLDGTARSFFVYAVGKASIHNHLSPAAVVDGSAAPSSPPPLSCAVPAILEPTPNQNVGPAIHLRVSGDSSCIASLHATIDGVDVLDATGASIVQWVSVAMGPHTLRVTATTTNGATLDAPELPFTRTD